MFQKRKPSLFNLNFLIILVKVINLLTIKKCKYWTPPPLPLGITREKNPFYNLQGKLQVFIFSFNVLVWMVMTPFERDKWPMGPFSYAGRARDSASRLYYWCVMADYICENYIKCYLIFPLCKCLDIIKIVKD